MRKLGNHYFNLTCESCPEQYDVFDKDGKQVAYVRLRWGELYAECPDVGGVEVYYTGLRDGLAGNFKNDHERKYHLTKISQAIDKHNALTEEVK